MDDWARLAVGDSGNFFVEVDESSKRVNKDGTNLGVLCLDSLSIVVADEPCVPAGSLQSVAQHALERLASGSA